MAQQVSGSDLSLIEAIRKEEIPTPQLFDWFRWQRWRKEEGRRPMKKKKSPYFTTPSQEYALYRAVMNDLYGDGWKNQLLRQHEVTAVSKYQDLLAETDVLAGSCPLWKCWNRGGHRAVAQTG